MLKFKNMLRFGLTLALCSATLPAFAAGQSATGRRIARASSAVQQAGARLIASARARAEAQLVEAMLDDTSGSLGAAKAAMALASQAVVRESSLISVPSSMEHHSSNAKSQVDFRALLGSFVFARDLQIPGAPSMAVRLIPSSAAAKGDASPIILTPRVVGVVGTSWYGLDLAAHF